MKKFIHWMYEDKSFIKDGIIYDTTDECRKIHMCKFNVAIFCIGIYTQGDHR